LLIPHFDVKISRVSSSPAACTGSSTPIQQSRAGDGAHLGTAWIYIGHESQGQKARRLFRDADRPHPVVMVRDAEAACACPQQSPTAAHGGGDRKGLSGRVHLLLPRLDLSSRRQAKPSAQPRLSADFKVGDPNMSNAVGSRG